MTARHAGPSRIADQAFIDQVKAAVEEIAIAAHSPEPFDCMRLCRWAGRAWALLEQVGELGE
jgi:hypothetical protein